MSLKPLTINLSDVLSSEYFTSQQRTALKGAIRDSSFKVEFAQRVIERILERTNSGSDKDGDSFTKYSAAYKKSRAFKVYGKTNTVNLKLSGEMQASIGLSKTSTTSISLNLSTPEQQEKARRHVEGDGVPVRDFWGISLEDQAQALKSTAKFLNSIEDYNALSDAISSISLTGTITARESDDGNVAQTLSIFASLVSKTRS